MFLVFCLLFTVLCFLSLVSCFFSLASCFLFLILGWFPADTADFKSAELRRSFSFEGKSCFRFLVCSLLFIVHCFLSLVSCFLFPVSCFLFLILGWFPADTADFKSAELRRSFSFEGKSCFRFQVSCL